MASLRLVATAPSKLFAQQQTIRNFHLSQRSQFGITDSIMGTVRDKMDDHKESSFKKMVEDMSNTPTWNMKKWKGTIEEQVNSWAMYVPGVSGSEQALKMKEILKVLEAMRSEELATPLTIKGAQKERIAISAGVTMDAVANMLLMYKQSLVVHEWLKLKKASGEPIPQTEAEMSNLQKNDTRLRKISMKIMMPRGQKRKGRGNFNL
jgi:signal recognition particle GTPase